MRSVAVILVAATLAATALAAPGTDPAAEALEGAWLVDVDNQARERFLVLSDVRSARGELTIGTGLYGWIDGKGRPVRGWQARIAGDVIDIRYVTPADSLIEATLKAGEALVTGTMMTRTGKPHEVRMTRLADDELAALRAAARGEKRAVPVARDAKIYLLYVGAADCVPCRRFEGRFGADGGGLKALAPEVAEARFVKASLASYREPLSPGALPEELAWVLQPAAGGKPPIRKRGTPFFALIVDHSVLTQGHGMTALETLVVPELKIAVDARRTAAGR
ncbi:MAG TPA: hypothetical protein VFB08_18930 [Burkholderiales bacterium]|nr:hypothetical protein [Burkholderiales bacterium]